MTQKINDTSQPISKGGRLKEYWDDHGVKQRRSSFVPFEENIDINGLLREYSLKGFEFGRYVNNEDRYDFVLATKDSLSDLGWLMKTDNLGIEYKIGIAFGARGRGGRVAAHYEPSLNMINLTKPNGAGAMAHEYGHALDYNIGTYIDQNKKYRALSGGRSMAKFPEDNTGGTVRLLMRKLIREIKTTQSFARLKDASDYWHYNTEVFARYFEQWCCYTLRAAKKSNGFLTQSWTYYTKSAEYLTEADFKKVLPTGNKLMKNIGLLLNGKKTEAFMDLEVANPEKVKKTTKPAKAKKAAAPKKTVTKAADPFADIKTLDQSLREKYYAGEITMKEAAERFHKAGWDTHVDLEATRKRIGVRPASKKMALKSETKTATKKAPKKGASTKTAYQDYDKAFRAVGKFSGNDPVRPIFSGVYHTDGDMVATEAHVLGVIHNAPYAKDKEGKIISVKQPGKSITGRYPNWKAVIPSVYSSDGGTVIDVADELEKVRKHIEKQKKLIAEYKQKGSDLSYYGLHTYVNGKPYLPYKFQKITVKPEYLEKCLNFMKAAGPEARFYQDKETPTKRAGVFRSGNLEALVMPVYIEN